MDYHAPIEYNIIPSMREELNFFEEYLNRITVKWPGDFSVLKAKEVNLD